MVWGHYFAVLSLFLAPGVAWTPLAPPGAPWRPPGPPGAPMTPGMSSWAIVSHPGSLLVIFDPSGVNNSSVYTIAPPSLPPTPTCADETLFCLSTRYWLNLTFSLHGKIHGKNVKNKKVAQKIFFSFRNLN